MALTINICECITKTQNMILFKGLVRYHEVKYKNNLTIIIGEDDILVIHDLRRYVIIMDYENGERCFAMHHIRIDY